MREFTWELIEEEWNKRDAYRRERCLHYIVVQFSNGKVAVGIKGWGSPEEAIAGALKRWGTSDYINAEVVYFSVNGMIVPSNGREFDG